METEPALERGLDARREVFPLLVIRPAQGLLGLRRRHQSAGRGETEGQRQDETEKGKQTCHSTKTPGMERGASVIQPGTGRPFSRRNSGFQSLDW